MARQQTLEKCVPESYSQIRGLINRSDFEGQTLLLTLLDQLRRGLFTLESLGLCGARTVAEEEFFIRKLRTIAAAAIVIHARGIHYSLDEQVEDFLLFSDLTSLVTYHHMSRFRYAAIQTILWVIDEEKHMAEQGIIPYSWRLPLDILVALGDEVAHRHEQQITNPIRMDVGNAPLPTECSVRTLIKSALHEVYHQIEDEIRQSSMHVALDRIRARFGVYTTVAVLAC